MTGNSMSGSLMTVAGSQPDMLASNLSMYNSQMTMNSLGEDHYEVYDYRYPNHSLSSDNLLIAPQLATGSPQNLTTLKNSIGVGTTKSAQKTIQRSRSDTVKTAMYASSPSVDNLTNSSAYQSSNQNRFINNNNSNGIGQQSPVLNQKTNIDYSPFPLVNNANNKSVTFMGLANAFQSLAQISLPVMASQQQPAAQQIQQQHQASSPANSNVYKNSSPYPLNDTQVKDSAYGSMESSNQSNSNGLFTSKSVSFMPQQQQTQQQQQQLVQRSQSQYQRQQTVRTQSSQQQRMYNETINGNSMKDTAYDRVALTNNQSNRRR